MTITILLCGLVIAALCAFAGGSFRWLSLALLVACVILAREAHVFV